jgi:DNA repair exonuclease SbcCD ATPase subunit
MTDLMKLADDYAASAATTPAPTISARADLQSAIEALQAECAEHKENAMRNARQAVAFRAERDQLQAENERLKARTQTLIDECNTWAQELKNERRLSFRAERDALQSKLDTAIQSSAHWQHQCTELQAKVDGYIADQQEGISISVKQQAEINQLQSRLDAMDKGEAVAYSVGNTLKWHEGKGMTNAQLYAAPKALAPLTDEQIDAVISAADASLRRRLGSIRGQQITQFDGIEAHVVRATEAAHGIHTKGGQHEGA